MSAVALAVLVCAGANALNRAHFVELNRRAAALAKQKDWPGFRALLLEMRDEMPGNLTPRWLLRMASVEARLGNAREGLHWLGQYARTGLVYDVAKDSDLAPLVGETGFRAIAQQFQENQKPVSRATVACVIPQPDLMPEDITYLPEDRSFVVTSIQRHGLYRLRLPRGDGQSCSLEEMSLSDGMKRWPALAVRHDRQRRALWMTTAAMPGFEAVSREDQGKTALFLRDDKTGEIRQQISPGGDGPTVFGDTYLSDDGTLYVTASIGGGIYRVAKDAATPTLEKIAQGFSPQTPAPSSDGRRLYVPDYPMGIAVVDLSAPSTTELNYLTHPDSVAVTGIDGLYLVGDSLIGIQNGTNPSRIMRYRLNRERTAIVSAEVLEQSEHSLDVNHAVLVDDSLYLLSNVGWNKVGNDGNLKSGEQFTNPVLLRLSIREDGGK
jgi:hypothetical protein